MTLNKLILEALKHDPKHPAFYDSEYSKIDKHEWEDSLQVADILPKDKTKLESEHKHLSKLHRVTTPNSELIKLRREHGKEFVDHRVNQNTKTLHAISRYTEDVSADLNANLIDNTPRKYWGDYEHLVHRDLLNHIDRITPLQKTHHVYSGLGFDPSNHFRKGIIKTPAWTSTSLHPLIARTFGERRQGSHIIHFELPAGYKNGAYIGHVSTFPAEHEFLLKPNQKWQLTNHAEHQITAHNKTHINMHVWSVKPHE